MESFHDLILGFEKRAVFFAIGDLQYEGTPIVGPKSEILIPIAGQRFRRDHQTVFILSKLAGLLAGQVRELGNNRGHKGAYRIGLSFEMETSRGLFCKQFRLDVAKPLEFEGIARGVAKKHGALLSRLSPEANVRIDDELGD